MAVQFCHFAIDFFWDTYDGSFSPTSRFGTVEATVSEGKTILEGQSLLALFCLFI